MITMASFVGWRVGPSTVQVRRERLRLPLLLLQDRNTNLQYLYPARDGLRGFTKAILYEWEAREEWEKGCWFGRSANWDERRVVPMVAISTKGRATVACRTVPESPHCNHHLLHQRLLVT